MKHRLIAIFDLATFLIKFEEDTKSEKKVTRLGRQKLLFILLILLMHFGGILGWLLLAVKGILEY